MSCQILHHLICLSNIHAPSLPHTHLFHQYQILREQKKVGGGKIKGKGRRAEEGLGGKGLREEEEGRGKQSAGEMGR